MISHFNLGRSCYVQHRNIKHRGVQDEKTQEQAGSSDQLTVNTFYLIHYNYYLSNSAFKNLSSTTAMSGNSSLRLCSKLPML